MATIVTERLRAEHRELLPHLDGLRAVAASLRAWDAAALHNRLNEVVDFLRAHLVPHARAEEAVLYPAVERAMGSVGAMDTMVADHVEIVRRIEALATTAGAIAAGPLRADQVEDLRAQLYGLWAILLLHFEKEEDVLLPVLDDGLSSAEAESLFAEMAAHEGQTATSQATQ